MDKDFNSWGGYSDEALLEEYEKMKKNIRQINLSEQELAEAEQKLAESILKEYEKRGTNIPQNDRRRKTIEHIMILMKLDARRWRKNPKCRCRQITINNVHRNEQINIAALCAGHQVIMCDNEMTNVSNDYYLLIPMQGIDTPFGEYKRNDFGEYFQDQAERKWGKKFEKFPRTYVAQVQRRPLLANNILRFWEELMDKGLFDLWDPKDGPVKWCQDHTNPHLPILRVFEIERDLASYIDFYKPGNQPYLVEKEIRTKATPVLTDEEFEKQCNSLLEIFKKHKLPY